ncbi:O-antigen ligase family protein, partial [Mariprofundus ferrooxydans]|nr:O-antigen ligase family protein [Mariprofundus ferrooxydans]
FPFRASANFIDPNSYAALGYLLLIPALACCFRIQGVERGLLCAVMVLLIAGITATGSRAGWLAAVGGCMFVLWRCRKETAFKPIAMLLVTAFLFFLLEMQWYSDFELAVRGNETVGVGSNNPGIQLRLLMWQSAWQLVLDGPWWGYGLGTFSLLYGAVRDPLDFITAGSFVHNDALQLLLEVGIPGLLLFVSLWLVMIVRLFLLLRKSKHDDYMEVAMLVAIILFGLHSLINFNFYNISLIMLLGMMMGYLDRGAAERVKLYSARLFWLIALPVFSVVVVLAFDIAGERLQMPIMQSGLAAKLDQQACLDAEKVSFVRPSMPGMYVHKAICALQYQQGCSAIVQAVSAMDEATQVSPLQPELYALKGQILMRAAATCIENPVNAGYLEFQRALSVNPAYLPARFVMANIQRQSGHPDVAKSILLDGLHYGMEIRQLNILKQRIKQFE